MPKVRSHFAAGRYLSFLAILAALSIFTGCSKKEQGTYIIGYVGSQSGANGALMAAEQATARKSSPYTTVKIVGIDATARAFTAEKALRSLNDAGARVIIDGAESLLGRETKAGKVVILTTGRNPKALATITDPLESAAAKMADQLRADKIFSVSVVYDLADNSYNWKWINAFRKHYEKNHGVIVKGDTINSSQEGWEKILPGQLGRALIEESRGLVVVAGTGAAETIVQEVRNLDKTIPLALAEQAFPTVLLDKAGQNLEGAVMVDFPPSDDSSQSYQQFAREYAGKFNSPANLTAASAYDAVGLIVAALRKDKDKKIADGLTALTEYEGVLGTTRNNSGTFIREAKLGRVINGRLAPIQPASPK